MKANLETITKHLQKNEEVLYSLFCTIGLGYISRPGILAATNEKLLFCADFMFGKGYKWEFGLSDLSDFKLSNGFAPSSVLFIPKITLYYQSQDFIVFSNFSDSHQANEFHKLIKSKLNILG